MANLTVDFPRNIQSLSDPAAQKQLIAFIAGLTENLKDVLNNLDEGNFNADVSQKIGSISEASEKAQQLAELMNRGELAETRNVRDIYRALRDSVFASMDNITATFSTLIEQLNSEIRLYVEGNFIAADPTMTLEERISSLISQTAEQIRFEFNTMATVNADAINALSVTFGTYFRFSENGLEIGKTGDGASPVVTRITNTRIEWVVAGTDVVLFYIDGSTGKGHLNMAEIDQLSLGNNVNGYVDIDMTSEGLFFRWRT